MKKLSDLNNSTNKQAFEAILPLVEKAPEIARRVAHQRPFRNLDHLELVIRTELQNLGEQEKIELFRSHPELAPHDPVVMTKESQSEQGRLNLTSREFEHRERLSELNTLYREKHGFPFITALVRHDDIDSVLTEFEARMKRDRNAEIEQAIVEIALVSSARVQASFSAGDAPVSKLDTSTT